MVTTPIDPRRVPSINQTAEEIAEMEAMIAAGKLPPDFIEQHLDAVDANVFGSDAPKDRKGFRLEQGIGAPGNMTKNSIDAYRKYHDPANPRCVEPDPDFAENLKKMTADLAKSDEARKARAPSGRRLHAGRE